MIATKLKYIVKVFITDSLSTVEVLEWGTNESSLILYEGKIAVGAYVALNALLFSLPKEYWEIKALPKHTYYQNYEITPTEFLWGYIKQRIERHNVGKGE